MCKVRRRRALKSAKSSNGVPAKAENDAHRTKNDHPGSRTRHGVDGTEQTARYGIDIRGASLHAEADDVAHIDMLLKGLDGNVGVFDRESCSLLFEGTVEEVRKALSIHTGEQIAI